MNLIACDQNCRHQQDGYCALNHITRLTAGLSDTCGYYEAQKKPRKNAKPAEKENRRPVN